MEIFLPFFFAYKNFLLKNFDPKSCRPFWKVTYMYIFACTYPNRQGVGVIDNIDRFEQVFGPYHISISPPWKDFHGRHSDDFSSENVQFWYFTGFISNFTYAILSESKKRLKYDL